MASAHVFLNPWVCSTNPTRNTENLGDDGAYTGGARKADAMGSSGAEEGERSEAYHLACEEGAPSEGDGGCAGGRELGLESEAAG
jgi:hypothetical protein